MGLFMHLWDNFSVWIGQNSIRSSKKELPISTPEYVLAELVGGVMTISHNGRITYVSEYALKLLGRSKSKILGLTINQLFLQNDQKTPINFLGEFYKSTPPESPTLFNLGELFLKGKEKLCAVDVQLVLNIDEQGNSTVIFRDHAAQKKLMGQLHKQASYDALTGLLNRHSFEEALKQLLRYRPANHCSHSLAMIDLDNFKLVNDTAGHKAGDELLKRIAHILRHPVRRSDKVVRMGGDEFAILLEDCKLDKSYSIMESILRELQMQPFQFDGYHFPVSASIGLVEFSAEQGASLEEIFARADKACYTAKALGRNQISVHISKSRPQQESEPAHTNWAQLLQNAIIENRFLLYMQPITPLQTTVGKDQAHYEILLRLPYKKNLLSPGSFLPAADRLEIMAQIDRWIIRRVLETLTTQYAPLLEQPVCLMINLSSQAVQDESMPEYIVEQLESYKVNPKLLCFEVSESVAIAYFRQTKRLMSIVSELGAQFALDDFGSGFSSLHYLRDLPIKYLKIDGNFVHNLVSNPVDAAIIKAIHEVSEVMSLQTIAELVEDKETLDQLCHIGISFAQGYYCGRPFPLTELYDSSLHLESKE